MSETPKSHWNYRVLRRGHDMGEGMPKVYTFDIREVYYTEGVANATTVNPMHPQGETMDELYKDIQMMVTSFDRPVIDDDNFPNEL